jgi:hypothetical protein
MNKIASITGRVKTVTHKGLFGKIEYHPARRIWSYALKLVYPITHKGEAVTEASATLELKKLMDTAATGNNKHVRSIE